LRLVGKPRRNADVLDGLVRDVALVAVVSGQRKRQTDSTIRHRCAVCASSCARHLSSACKTPTVSLFAVAVGDPAM